MRKLLPRPVKKSIGLRVVWEVQGSLVKVEVKGNGQRGGGMRLEIKGFTEGSRKRLFEKLNRLDSEGLKEQPKFMTLTTKELYHPEVMSIFLDRMLKRVKKISPGASAIWKKEFQKRGAVHYHLMWFELPYMPFRDLRKMWAEIVDEWDPMPFVRIEAIRTWRGVLWYVGKYIAKVEPEGVDYSSLFNIVTYSTAGYEIKGKLGRFWGVHNKSELPLAKLRSGNEDYGLWVKKAKYLANKEWDGIDVDALGGFTLFVENSDNWVENLKGGENGSLGRRGDVF